MSDLSFNKIAFCILGTALAVIGLNEASHSLFHTAHHDKMGMEVVIADPTGPTGPVAEGPRDYFKLISTADVAAGAEVHKKCLQCHNFDPGGVTLQGPPLYGVLGRDIASLAGFKYSTGKGSLSEHEGAWDYEKLDHFLERPKGFASATLMNFAGVGGRTGLQNRANLIAFLRTLTAGEPMPLPAPLPEQPTAPADGAAAPAEGATPPVDGATPAVPGATPAPAAPGAPAQASPGAPATPAPAPH